MSDVYVRWDDLKKVSDRLVIYAKKIDLFKTQLESVKSSIKMSKNLSEGILHELNTEIEKMNRCKIKIKEYSNALKKKSEEYQRTENKNYSAKVISK